MFRKILFSAVLSCLAFGQEAPSIHPIIKLEKSRFVLGESILLWLGLEFAVPGKTLPHAPCSLDITKPGGSHESSPITWPIGGLQLSTRVFVRHTLDPAVAGNYTLVLECPGASSEPLTLTVVRDSIAKQIKIALEFKKSGALHRSASVPFVFNIRNNSPYFIQFPERGTQVSGTVLDGIMLHIVRRDPPETTDVLYPPEKLAKPVGDAPANNPGIPTINLVPGGHFEQQLYVEDAYKLDQPGQYEISISTIVTLVARDRNGNIKDISPIRLITRQTANFTISNSVY